jgi:FkbM family methyltransferase
MSKVSSRSVDHPSRCEPWEVDFPATATEADVLHCFRLLLGRNPSKQEWPGHSLHAGEDLASVVSGYFNSQEFADRHLLDRKPAGVGLVDLPQFRMFACADDPFIGREIVRAHNYEPHVSRVFREYVKPGMGILDVGANIGYFSLLSASLVGPSGSVYSWEPSPDNVKMLYASQLENAFTNIHIIQAAATEATTLLKYFRSSSNGNVAEVNDLCPKDALSVETVLGLRIDDIVPRSAKIGFMKIDVEGFEVKALAGALDTIQRNRPIVVSEFSPPQLQMGSGASGEEYLSLFVELGYELFVITEAEAVAGSVSEVLGQFEQSNTDHIDILLKPRTFRT